PPTITTWYKNTLTDACQQTLEDSLQVEVKPYTLNVSAGQAEINCGSTTQLNAQVIQNIPGLLYQWAPAKSLSNPNIASPIAKPGLSTTYTVQVSTANGCMEEETIDIKVNNPNPPKVEISSNTGSLKLCDGGITLSISGFVSQEWSTGSENANIFVTQPGVYSVTAFDANGCAGFASVE